MATEQGSYTINVVFMREHDEDDEIAAGNGTDLIGQLMRELQEAYDECGIAGHFVAGTLEEGSGRYDMARKAIDERLEERRAAIRSWMALQTAGDALSYL